MNHVLFKGRMLWASNVTIQEEAGGKKKAQLRRIVQNKKGNLENVFLWGEKQQNVEA